MDKNYWENYYKVGAVPQKQSPFAEWVLKNYLKENISLLELGCGNGRDSVYFAENNIQVIATDQCVEEIEVLTNNINHPNIKFLTADFTNLDLDNYFDAIYSRFTLHSITEEEEDRTIAWVRKNMNPGGKFLIEARGHKNEIYRLGEPVPNQPHAFIYENHYRRFVELETLLRKLEENGFTIMFNKEEKGFAPYKDTDYTFFRVIATI